MNAPTATARVFGIVFAMSAGVHVGLTIGDPGIYTPFADGAPMGWVLDAWRATVVANPPLWIGLLAAYELITGIMLLWNNATRTAGYIAAIVFHMGLLFFGWGFWAYAVPVLAILAMALRKEITLRQQAALRDDQAQPTPAA